MLRPLHILVAFSLLLLVISLSLTSSTDLTQDLGRHIKLGEIIVQTGAVPSTNLFSYTNQLFPFINHHWLSEVIFYAVSSLFGFSSLVILKTVLIVGACAFVWYTGQKKAGLMAATTTAALIMPLLAERSYIRPEVFGYFFFAVILYLLIVHPTQKKFLFLLPVIMLVWANIHITFIFGYVLLAAFIGKLMLSHRSAISRQTLIVFCLAFFAPLINPQGIAGFLYPLQIFRNYGYTIVENQNLFFLDSLIVNSHIKYFFLLSPLIAGALIVLGIKRKWIEGLVLLVFWLATFYQIRHMPFFVLAASAIVPVAVVPLARKLRRTLAVRILTSILLIAFMLGVSGMFFSNWYYQTFDLNRGFGTEVADEARNAAEFMNEHALPANMFNNFDIGGYAIYSLYPRYKVFIDNRPEAYPAAFIQDVYIKAQQLPEIQAEVFQRYNIHTVFFSHTDQTPWATTFMARILQDPQWKLIYLDETMMILSDQTTQADVRTDEQRLRHLVESQDSYLPLLKLGRILSLAGKPELADRAYTAAIKLNPESCAIQRSIVNRYADTVLINKINEIKSTYWYCFF